MELFPVGLVHFAESGQSGLLELSAFFSTHCSIIDQYQRGLVLQASHLELRIQVNSVCTTQLAARYAAVVNLRETCPKLLADFLLDAHQAQ